MKVVNLKDENVLIKNQAKNNENEINDVDFICYDENTINYSLIESGIVIGGIDFRIVLDSADILFIYIRKENRGYGYSKILFNESIKELKELGVKEIFLEVKESNVIAYNLYKTLGFIEIGRRNKYYKDGIDAISMKMVI